MWKLSSYQKEIDFSGSSGKILRLDSSFFPITLIRDFFYSTYEFYWEQRLLNTRIREDKKKTLYCFRIKDFTFVV